MDTPAEQGTAPAPPLTFSVLGFPCSLNREQVALFRRSPTDPWNGIVGVPGDKETGYEAMIRFGSETTGYDYQFPAWTSFAEIWGEGELTRAFFVMTDLTEFDLLPGTEVLVVPTKGPWPSVPLAPCVARLLPHIHTLYDQGRLVIPREEP